MIIQLCPPSKYTYPPIHFRKIEMTTKILQFLSDSPPPTVRGGGGEGEGVAKGWGWRRGGGWQRGGGVGGWWCHVAAYRGFWGYRRHWWNFRVGVQVGIWTHITPWKSVKIQKVPSLVSGLFLHPNIMC